MFNYVKNIVYSKFKKNSFEENGFKVYDHSTETVYRKEDTIYVEVLDETIGKRLYDVLHWLKKNKANIGALSHCYKHIDYIYDTKKVVKWFSYKYNSSLYDNWHWLEDYKKVKEFAHIVEFFEQNGFVLDSETFLLCNCDSISEVFSYFVPISEDAEKAKTEIEQSRAFLIEYAHYMLSKTKETILEDYDKIDKSGEIIIKADIFGYNVCLLKMCYEYYKFGSVPQNVFEILKYDNLDCSYAKTLNTAYVLNDDYESRYSITEQTEKYTMYDGTVKIYNPNILEKDDDESAYKDFLVNNVDRIKQKYSCAEKLERLIFNLNNEFVGSIIRTREDETFSSSCNISNVKFENQADIICFIKCLSLFISKLQGTFRSDIKRQFQKECDLKSSIKYYVDSGEYVFSIISIREMYNLTHTDQNRQILKIFFDFLKEFLTEKYGKMHIGKEILEKIEVRSLSPLVAKTFIKYVLENNRGAKPLFENNEVIDELYEMLNHYKIHHTSTKSDMFCFDLRFEYDPAKIPIVFGDEVEEKYQIKINKGTKTILPDGRCMEVFGRASNIEKIASKEKATRETLSGFFKNLEDEHVKVVGISELIYSRELNTANMYKLIGYIKEPIKGEKITDKYLCRLPNKDLYKIGGYLFSKFTEYYLPSTDIYVDENFIFYIDILQKEFKVKQHESHFNLYPETVFERLCSNKGYKKEALSDWNMVKDDLDHSIVYIEGLPLCFNMSIHSEMDFNIEKYNEGLKKVLLNIADSLDSYCNEHNMYYKSSENQCPICRKIKYLVEPDIIRNTAKLLFEDIYAQHYKLNDELNIKLYKTVFSHTDVIEENIVEIINSSYDVAQDCFVPCKKAIDKNNKFVGYVYKTVQFEKSDSSKELCINLNDSSNLAILPMLKSLKRLILQVKELIKDREAGFIRNPFTNVFLNPNHKKQVQILNVEFFCKGDYATFSGLALLTEKWTCQYVSKILSLNKSISLSKNCKELVRYYCDTTRKPNARDYTQDLTTLLECITRLSEEMTKYCIKHKSYYSNKMLFCPKCMPDTALQQYLTIKKDKNDFLRKEPDNEGGESFIYSYQDGLIAKVFKSEQINISLKESTLCGILLKKDLLAELNKKAKKFHYVVPKKVLVDENTAEVFGYVMESLKDVQPISNLKHKSIVEELEFTQKDILEILITIGEGIEAMHEKANIYIGDLNGQNILFDSKKNVYFIDFDGMGVEDIAPEFCTDGYIDPVSKETKNITMKDDWYSYAIQVFYYLTYTHPFNGIYYETNSSGKKVMLEIPDKMKKKVSLLGNHGLKPPAVAEPWDWMNSELQKAFLEIFERDLRQSIVPLLKKQYKTLISNDYETELEKTSLSDEVIRINPKFIARELHPFGNKVKKTDIVKVINQYAVECQEENYKFVVLISKKAFNSYIDGKADVFDGENYCQVKAIFEKDKTIQDVKLSDDGEYAFIRYSHKGVWDAIIIVSLKQKESPEKVKHYVGELSQFSKMVVDQKTIYYTGTQYCKPVIFKFKIESSSTPISIALQNSNYEVSKEVIPLGNHGVDWFNVKNESKFVLIRRNDAGFDEVYCNSDKLCHIEYKDGSSEYNIIYDESKKKWLIVNTEGNGIIIYPNGAFSTIDLKKYNNNNNMLGIFFKNGIIYIPDKKLTIIDISDFDNVKQLECDKVMDENSQILDVNNKGFIVKTNNTLYEVCKG